MPAEVAKPHADLLTWEQAVADGAWGNTELAALAAQFGTPSYVYAADMITAACQHYQQCAGEIGADLHYAMKANGNLAVLQLIKKAGLGFDAASVLELERCAAIDIRSARTIVTGPGKSVELLERAMRNGVREIIADGSEELERISALNHGPTKITVGVRVNPDIDSKTHPHIATGHGASKFGVNMAQAQKMCMQIATTPQLRLGSLSAHIGSQISSCEPYVETARLLLKLRDELVSAGVVPKQIDLGGGFGIGDNVSRLDHDVFAELVAWLKKNCPDQQFAFQPGRALVGRAGILLTKVEYRKGRHIIVDAGMTELIRPALYGSKHGVAKLGMSPAPEGKMDVVGPVCENTDYLAQNIELDANPGDLLAIFDAGAYGSVMMSNYNGRLRCCEVMLDDNQARLVRRRETVADVLAAETAPLGG